MPLICVRPPFAATAGKLPGELKRLDPRWRRVPGILCGRFGQVAGGLWRSGSRLPSAKSDHGLGQELVSVVASAHALRTAANDVRTCVPEWRREGNPDLTVSICLVCFQYVENDALSHQASRSGAGRVGLPFETVRSRSTTLRTDRDGWPTLRGVLRLMTLAAVAASCGRCAPVRCPNEVPN